jgi:hypothetical protein
MSQENSNVDKFTFQIDGNTLTLNRLNEQIDNTMANTNTEWFFLFCRTDMATSSTNSYRMGDTKSI